MFMGAEIGQWHEWDDAGQLDWYLLSDNEMNRQTKAFFKAANEFYAKTPALWEIDFNWEGFEWLVADDNQNNVVVFLRKDKAGNEVLCAVNFSPNTYESYRVGVPARKRYVPVLNSDDPAFGGSGFGDTKAVKVEKIPSHGKEQSVSIKIPSFGGVIFKSWGKLPVKTEEPVRQEETVKADAAETAETTE